MKTYWVLLWAPNAQVSGNFLQTRPFTPNVNVFWAKSVCCEEQAAGEGCKYQQQMCGRVESTTPVQIFAFSYCFLFDQSQKQACQSPKPRYPWKLLHITVQTATMWGRCARALKTMKAPCKSSTCPSRHQKQYLALGVSIVWNTRTHTRLYSRSASMESIELASPSQCSNKCSSPSLRQWIFWWALEGYKDRGNVAKVLISYFGRRTEVAVPLIWRHLFPFSLSSEAS